MFTGGCLCGAVQYQVTGELDDVVGCHCSQCRKTTGHFVAATRVNKSQFNLIEESGLKWYRSSDEAQRGFCAECGSQLFWQADDRDNISIMAGTLDGDIGVTLTRHIYAGDKGSYYDLEPHLPQFHDTDYKG